MAGDRGGVCVRTVCERDNVRWRSVRTSLTTRSCSATPRVVRGVQTCTNRFGRLRAELRLSGVRLHDLRHFVATVLCEGGHPIATVSGRLGHGDIATTLNLYTHTFPAAAQRAAANLGGLLTGEERVVAERHRPR